MRIVFQKNGRSAPVDALPERRVIAATEHQQRAAGSGVNLFRNRPKLVDIKNDAGEIGGREAETFQEPGGFRIRRREMWLGGAALTAFEDAQNTLSD